MTPTDPERFDALYAEHYRAVLAYALRRVDPIDADDVVAETFMVAWRRLDEVPEHALPWLLGVARNRILHQRRSASRRQALVEQIGRQRQPEWRESGTSGALVAAISQLPPKEREMVMLVCWEGLTPAEAANLLGITQVSARVRLHRARRRLMHTTSVIVAGNGPQEVA